MSSLRRFSVCAVLFVLVVSIALAQTRGSDSNSVAEVGSIAQHIIARTYINPATGQGYACFWLPFLYGIPESILFDGTTKSEKTARFTARFSPFQAEPLPQNGDMVNALFSAGHDVNFYYKEHPSQFNQDWDHPDAFNSGTLIATYPTRRNLLSQIGTVGFFVNSAPLSFSRDFTAADGKVYNFRDLTPGGITVNILASTTPIVSAATAPLVQIPFSGVGIHMGSKPENRPPTVATEPASGTVTVQRQIMLDASKSTDPEGDPLTFAWTNGPGLQAAILGANTATPSVQFGSGRGPYIFQLKVTDSRGRSSTANVIVNYAGL